MCPASLMRFNRARFVQAAVAVGKERMMPEGKKNDAG
jgi:hypothetical protein